MKSEPEIKEAHDILVGIILGQVPEIKLTPAQKALAVAQADVLCWILEHKHNVSFKENVDRFKLITAKLGYVLGDSHN